MNIWPIATTLALFAAPALAQDAAPKDVTPKEAAPKEAGAREIARAGDRSGDHGESAAVAVTDDGQDDKVVCRTSKTIGSRVKSRKVCMTKQQWRDVRFENREQVDRIQAGRGTYTRD